MTPLIMPDTPSGIAKVRFEIERVDFAAPEASGRVGGVQAGWPLWMATYDIDRSDPESGDLWTAFFDRLRGRQRLFLAGDPTRNFPKSRPSGFAGMLRAGGGAFDGSATSWSQTFDADNNAKFLCLGLPTGMTLSPRDLIGFKWDAVGSPAGTYNRRAMTRVVEVKNSDGGGGLNVMVEPPIDTSVVPAGAIAHFDNPRCLMRIIPEKSNLGPIGAGGAIGGGNIVAVQDLRV